MKKINKAIFPAAALVLAAAVLLGANFLSSNNISDNADSLPVSEVSALFTFDRSNTNMAVGDSDYVFVGKVLKNTGTQYKNYAYIEGKKVGGFPYTYYEVQVMENIKGALKTDNPIEVQKKGGIALSKKSITLYENDQLPVENGIYIFVSYAQQDGSILVSGPYSNIPVDIAEGQDIVSTQQYQEYKNAYENEVMPSINEGVLKPRERSKSIYEE